MPTGDSKKEPSVAYGDSSLIKGALKQDLPSPKENLKTGVIYEFFQKQIRNSAYNRDVDDIFDDGVF